MALRARLVAPPPPAPEAWPWHTLKCGPVSSSILSVGDRRMEAETYLSSGYGIRLAIEAKASDWTPFRQVARVEQPGRLKGILVSPEHGTPFLAATQVFDVRPIPRKFLALDQMEKAKSCFVADGTILVTRSGAVGRSTLAHAPHRGVVISDDLLRVSAKDKRDFGWLYAYLRTPQVRAMTVGAQYGHIIKHLEISHLEALPIPTVDDATADDFAHRVARILDLRNEGHRLTLEAESRFERALGPLKVSDWGDEGFTVKASKAFLGGRRRFDASVHNPGVAAIRRHLDKNGEGLTSIADADYDVWLPTRFRRVPAEDGVPLVESAALVEVNPDIDKRIAEVDFGDSYRGRVNPGWLLVARSGQIYGINGTAVLATEALVDHVISDDVIRVAPRLDSSIRAGYFLVALSHPILGRPLVKSLAYGSSIPHIDPTDLVEHKVVRLKRNEETAIADLAEASARARATADVLEREIARNAGAIVERFMAS